MTSYKQFGAYVIILFGLLSIFVYTHEVAHYKINEIAGIKNQTIEFFPGNGNIAQVRSFEAYPPGTKDLHSLNEIISSISLPILVSIFILIVVVIETRKGEVIE